MPRSAAALQSCSRSLPASDWSQLSHDPLRQGTPDLFAVPRGYFPVSSRSPIAPQDAPPRAAGGLGRGNGADVRAVVRHGGRARRRGNSGPAAHMAVAGAMLSTAAGRQFLVLRAACPALPALSLTPSAWGRCRYHCHRRGHAGLPAAGPRVRVRRARRRSVVRVGIAWFALSADNRLVLSPEEAFATQATKRPASQSSTEIALGSARGCVR